MNDLFKPAEVQKLLAAKRWTCECGALNAPGMPLFLRNPEQWLRDTNGFCFKCGKQRPEKT